MNIKLFEQLHRKGLLTDTSLERIRTAEANRLFSLHWELKTLLYLGVLLFSGGLGTLVYKNIDTIGHQIILLFIAAVSGACFYYGVRKKLPFSRHKVLPPNHYFDYIVLLGCLTFVSFITYVQVQYLAFGMSYSAAAFVPMAVLFVSAYYFDHIGILSLAITNLAAFMGLVVTPLNILSDNDFSSNRLVFTGMLLGVMLVCIAYFSQWKNIKRHFIFTYSNFGVHILYISMLAAMIVFENLLWVVPIGMATFLFLYQAKRERSYYFVMISILYAWIALTYFLLYLLIETTHGDGLFFAIIYTLGSAIGMIFLLINEHKKLKNDTRI